ncbi:hypothetical protein Tco_0270103, partial [Tanacetum coccineum]
QSKVSFLGHVINREGVQVEQEKVAAVQSWLIPSNVKEVRGFLGLTDILQQLQSDPSSVLDSSSHDGLIFFKGRMGIPDTPNLKIKLLQECHTSPTGGHGWFLKTLKRLSL